MRVSLALLLCTLALGCAALPAYAAEVNFAGTIVGAFPVGAFADKEGIISQSPYGWRAIGGAAGTGFGFNLELETRVGKVTWLGLRFGYVKYGADATDLRNYINSVPDTSSTPQEVTAMDGAWTHTFISFPVRFIARDFKSGNTCIRVDIGWVKVTNSYDGTVSYGDPPADQPFTSDFNLGNQFFLAAGVGVDFRVGKSLAIITEVRYNYIFLGGAEATSTAGLKTIRALQDFNAQTVEVVVGVRIPLGGI
jgi:hypothetical protein